MNASNKIKLKIFGQVGYPIFLGIIIFAIIMAFAIKYNTLSDKDKFALLYASPFLMIVVLLIGKNIFKQIHEIATFENAITFRNILTKQVSRFELNNIKGFRFNGLTQKVYILDQNENILTVIYEPFYKDLNIFLTENKIEYLGRSKTWFSA